jgi:hypothetical protein
MARKPNPIKKYIVTSYIPNADLCYDFIHTLQKCAAVEGAELLVGQSKANYRGDLETPYEHMIQYELGKHLVKDFRKLNDKIAIHDFHESINVIDPLSGVESDVADRGCLIIPFPRHRFKTVPRMLRESGAPRAAWCTGSISHPYYKPTKSGSRMSRYHVYGALMVEVVDDEHFNIRQLTWDGKGFYDLDKYYTKSGVSKNHAVAALSMGDDHAVFQDPRVMEATYALIEKINPKYLFRHDTFDACSVTHHLDSKKLTKALVNLSLEEEARITARSIKHVEVNYPKINQVMVASNHPEHLDRYLDEARYKHDTTNHVLALELAWKKSEGKNVVEYLLNKYQPLNKTQFLARKQSFKVLGIEMVDHGDEGANGARGSSKEKGIVYSGKSVTGHTHSPEIGVYGNYVNGTSTFLSLGYTKDSGSSSWLNTHTIVYPNGKMSHYHIIPR